MIDIILQKLICEQLNSINELDWSPNSENLSIWCSNSGESKLIIYSTKSESQIGVFCPKDPFQRKREDIFYRELRGIEIAKWMPSSQLIAIAGHNEIVIFYILHNLSYKVILLFFVDNIELKFSLPYRSP